jgi:arylsulfatase A-like enzyme
MKPKKPNIVFLLSDHQAYYRHGWDDGNKPLRPKFEEFVKEGIEFNNAYCATPLCSPVRRTMLNGQFPHKHKNFFNDSSVPYNEETYLRKLHDVGYKNYHFGKWHAGAQSAITAGQHCEGFSCEGYGNPYITETYKNYLEKRNLPTAEHYIHYDFTAQRLRDEGFFHKLEEGKLYRCESSWAGEHAAGITVTPKDTHESFFLANLACDQLEKLANEEDPFYMSVHFWGPHQPFFPTQEYVDMYDSKSIKEYGNFNDDLSNKADVHKIDGNRMISNPSDLKLIYPNPLPWSDWQKVLTYAYAHQTMIDDAHGRIIAKIKELGLEENTVVIWATDHGDSLASHGGHFDKASFMSQEVLRIPMAIRWPKVIEPNQKRNQLVSNIDIPLTILDIAGTKFTHEVHGRSLLPLSKDPDALWRDDLMCETAGHGYVEKINGRLIIHNEYKLVLFENQMDELYHLISDPYEMKNLAYNPAYDGIKSDLLIRLKRWQKETNDTVFTANKH